MSIERKILQSRIVSCDTETNGLLAWQGNKPFGISFFSQEGDELYYEWPVDPFTREVHPDPVQLEFCSEFLGSPNILKVFFHAKFDIRMMEVGFGIKTVFPIDEVIFMAHACNSLEARVALKYLVEKYLGMDTSDEAELDKLVIRCRRIAKKKGWMIATDEMTKEPVKADKWLPKALDPTDEHCEHYCVMDSIRTMLLRKFYKEHAMPELGVEDVYRKEMELWQTIYDMETRGVACDLPFVQKEVKRYTIEQKKWGDFIVANAWPEIDLDSPADLGKLFYDKLKLPVKRRTPTGKPQVNVDALEEFGEHPVGRAVSKFRAASKALSSFFGKYQELICEDPLVPGAYALHPEIRQVGPATGRTAMANPNFQNTANALGTRSREPIQARTPFGPRPGHIWVMMDYEGQEVRIFADVSGEMELLNAIKAGYNAHNWTANKAWGGEDNPRAIEAACYALELSRSGIEGVHPNVLPLWKEFGIREITSLSQENKNEIASVWLSRYKWDIVTAEAAIGKKNHKNCAKMLFFAKIYGGGPNAVSDLLRCSYQEAQNFLAIYDEIFPRIRQYIRELSNQARRDGFIINRYGRRLTVSLDKPYKAVNYEVQGDAADLLKASMLKCGRLLRGWGLDWFMEIPIHDEIVFEVRREHAFKCCIEAVRETMEDNEGHFNIETPVDVKIVTTRWDKKQKLVYRRLNEIIVA